MISGGVEVCSSRRHVEADHAASVVRQGSPGSPEILLQHPTEAEIERRKKIEGTKRMELNTYLNYGGNCEQAFRFYEQHLGGKITMLMRHGEQPNPSEMSPDWKGRVLHARMNLGGTELLGADIPSYEPMRSAYLSLTVNSNEEAERVYGLLSDGGQIFMPIQETFFAARFAMLRDRFGTSWMLLHPRPQSAAISWMKPAPMENPAKRGPRTAITSSETSIVGSRPIH
jgi:PhnB protein